MKLDVIGWGALNVDRLFHVDEFVKNDGETYINYHTRTPGGSAANTLIALAKFGMKTGCVGKVGGDDNGQILTLYLDENKVNTDAMIRAEGSSGEVLGFIDSHGNRRLYVTPNINDKIEKKDIDIKYLKNSRIVHLTSFVGLNPKDPSIDTQFEVMEQIRDDVTVSFDPGMLYATRSDEFIDRLLDLTDILLVNETEVKLMMNTDSLDEAISRVSGRVDILVVKRSTAGSFIKTKDEEYNIGVFDVDVVDTTGAGDAYNAGFLYGILNNYSLEDSGIIGSYIAATSITRTGATEAIPSISDISIDDIIQSYKK